VNRRSREAPITAAIPRRRFLRITLGAASGATLAGLLVACGPAPAEQKPASQPAAAPPTAAAPAAQPTAAAAPAKPAEAPKPTEAPKPAAPAADAKPTTAPAAAPAKPEGRLAIAQGVDVGTFDPHEDTSTAAGAIFQNIFDNLVARDQNLKLVPSLAESWKVVDQTTWQFSLRRGVMFHDGTGFTAKDVKWAFDHVLDPANNSRRKSSFDMVADVQAVDDYTVQLKTKEPYAPLLPKLLEMFIVSADAYQKLGAQKFATAPVGTGPYKMTEFVKDNHVRVERFDGHWRGKGAIGTAEFRPIPEASTRVAALKAGELDVATLMPVTEIAAINSGQNTAIKTIPSAGSIFCGMNTLKAPLNDQRVRQALNYAVDVQAIIDNLLDGHDHRLASVSAPVEFGYNPDLKPYTYDLDKAKSLLAEAGVGSGFSTVLDTPRGRYLQDVEVAQAIAGQLGKVGVKVEVRPAEFQEYFSRWLKKEMEGLYILGSGSSLLDADWVMGAHLDSKRRGLYYNSPETDQLIRASAIEMDPQKREKMYFDLEAKLHDIAPWIFLYEQDDIYGIKKSLQWTPAADERLWLYDMKTS
jgi:peptide/nickel transport system substrate-binding protein